MDDGNCEGEDFDDEIDAEIEALYFENEDIEDDKRAELDQLIQKCNEES